MNTQLIQSESKLFESPLIFLGVFQGEEKKTQDKPNSKIKKDKKGEKENALIFEKWPLNFVESYKALKHTSENKGAVGESTLINLANGSSLQVIGLGKKSELKAETIRKELARNFKKIQSMFKKVTWHVDSFIGDLSLEETLSAGLEGLYLSSYQFTKYKSAQKKEEKKEPELSLFSIHENWALSAKPIISKAKTIADSIFLARNFVNEPPNVLFSTSYAKMITDDAKTLGTSVSIKTLNKTQLEKEKMNLLLSVNQGSNHPPYLIHLHYRPRQKGNQKGNKKAKKHVALVGKGITFDTGGHSLKISGSMMNMKFDMAGSATVYAAFRTAVKLNLEVEISCFLAITDNAISNTATFPDSIITARNGKTVEILNTDAEGRLILADALDYACDQKPDCIIDVATLTGACVAALGTEVAGLMSNNDTLSDDLLKSAKAVDEYLWRLPLIQEYRDDMKSNTADIQNIGKKGNAGAQKGGIFLEHFIKNNIPWAHIDIAGIGDSQGHLPYCPPNGGSGLIVRTLLNYLEHV